MTGETRAIAGEAFRGEARRRSDLAAARSRLPVVARDFAALLSGIEDPSRPAVGEWTIGDVAAHVSHVAGGGALVAMTVGNTSGEGLSVGDDLVAGAAAFNARTLANDPERDVRALAERVEKSVADLLETTAPLQGDEPVAWLGGLVLPASGLPCHLMGELLVHGFDVARAAKRPWPMGPVEAGLAFGFFMDAIRFSPASMRRGYVHQDAAAGLRAVFEFRVRGGRTYVLDFDDGSLTVSDPPVSPVDCRISAAPAAALLSAFGRIGRARPVLSGRIVAWGRRPWLALKLPRLLRNP
ncbi:MAG: maleylpyruvate isomerase family mycothiol-dependent enzyme [Actinomycetota bacterium]|nr:maleylpyruvate isomerase family mycothiol-dependent enzyme [Actinomycetota bacterium]